MTAAPEWIDVLELLRDTPAAQRPSERLRARLLAATQEATRFEGFIDRLAVLFGGSHEHARAMVARIDREEAWLECGVPGHRYIPIPGYGDAARDLLMWIRIEPGHVFPTHTHPTAELSFCIQGGARIRESLVLEAGDFLITEAGEAHACHSVRGEPCIMLLRRHGPPLEFEH